MTFEWAIIYSIHDPFSMYFRMVICVRCIIKHPEQKAASPEVSPIYVLWAARQVVFVYLFAEP